MIGCSSSFVGTFNGYLGSNTRCCPYYKLVPLSNGCPYYCTYCYLACVYRKYSPFIKLNVNYDSMFRQIRKTVSSSGQRADFNMGEMLDSLALDHITNLTPMLVPFFSGFSKAYLMLLTKSSNIDNLLLVEPHDHVVVSWSLNADDVINQYEIGTASLTERLEAAQACQRHGYRIRFRIDPGVIYEDWKAGYADMIEKIYDSAAPENLTLGMLRVLPGHSKIAIDAYGKRAAKLFDYELVKGAADGKLRFPPKKRVEFYSFLIDRIRSFDKNVSISLCRETCDVWEPLKYLCLPNKCNCVTW